MAADPHTLVVINPGHFHAALTLRKRHPRLRDDVYVYAEDGPDLERFLAIVETFNARAEDPTQWRLQVARGRDYLERAVAERPGTLAVIATRNDIKMDLIARLHRAGFSVLGDKPWIVDASQLQTLRETLAGAPLAMDIMTERKEACVRLQQRLIRSEEIFGAFDVGHDGGALSLQSVHFLAKQVNGKPLVRPAWYFDTHAQGEGMTDVNTHLVDLALWMIGDGRAWDADADQHIVDARQWPTAVPRATFARITELDDFPDALRERVTGAQLQVLCNAQLDCRLRGIPVRCEALWGLAIAQGGGDTHEIVARGTGAIITVRHDRSTGFRPALTVRSVRDDAGFAGRLHAALDALQGEFPGVQAQPLDRGFRIAVPEALRTTHEAHFAMVLDDFLAAVDRGQPPAMLAADLIAKYTLLARAKAASRRLSASGPRAVSFVC